MPEAQAIPIAFVFVRLAFREKMRNPISLVFVPDRVRFHYARGKYRGCAQLDAERTRPIIADLRAKGFTAIAGLTEELNRRGYTTGRGRHWYPATLRRLLHRLYGIAQGAAVAGYACDPTPSI